MPKNQMTFEKRYPGYTADPQRQKDLMRLALRYAGYQRDVASLNWLLGQARAGLAIPQNDQETLKCGWAIATLKLGYVLAQMDNGAIEKLNCPVVSQRTLTSKLQADGVFVAPIYEKYYNAYYTGQLNEWATLYTKAQQQWLDVEAKDLYFRTAADKQIQYTLEEICCHIKECARMLGKRPSDVFKGISAQQRQAADEELKASRDQRLVKNATRIQFLLNRIEKNVVFINGLGAGVRPPLDQTEQLQRDMQDFYALTGYALQDWYQLGLTVPAKKPQNQH